MFRRSRTPDIVRPSAAGRRKNTARTQALSNEKNKEAPEGSLEEGEYVPAPNEQSISSAWPLFLRTFDNFCHLGLCPARKVALQSGFLAAAEDTRTLSALITEIRWSQHPMGAATSKCLTLTSVKNKWLIMPSSGSDSSLIRPKMPCHSPRQPVDNGFDSSETLFRRVRWIDIREDGHPYPESFVFNASVSVNRSRYSTARCVLCSCTCKMAEPSASFAPFELETSAVLSDSRVTF